MSCINNIILVLIVFILICIFILVMTIHHEKFNIILNDKSDINSLLSTGDILLFRWDPFSNDDNDELFVRYDRFTSLLSRSLGGGDVSHVGICYKHNGVAYCIEIRPANVTSKRMKRHKVFDKYDSYVIPLEHYINEYNGDILVKKLKSNFNFDEYSNNDKKNVIDSIIGFADLFITFDLPVKMFRKRLEKYISGGIFGDDDIELMKIEKERVRERKACCSEYIIRIMKCNGIAKLKTSKQCCQYVPMDFVKNINDDLNDGFYYEDSKLIVVIY